MKYIAVLTMVSMLSGCQALGPWVAAHEAGITAFSTLAGGVVVGENVVIDSITIKKDITPQAK